MDNQTSEERKFTIDWPHGHRTRDGRKARVLGVLNGESTMKVVVAVQDEEGRETAQLATIDGSYNGRTKARSADDLFDIEPVGEAWLNINREKGGLPFIGGDYGSRNAANQMATGIRIACRKVRIETNGKITDITDEEPATS